MWDYRAGALGKEGFFRETNGKGFIFSKCRWLPGVKMWARKWEQVWRRGGRCNLKGNLGISGNRGRRCWKLPARPLRVVRMAGTDEWEAQAWSCGHWRGSCRILSLRLSVQPGRGVQRGPWGGKKDAAIQRREESGGSGPRSFVEATGTDSREER